MKKYLRCFLLIIYYLILIVVVYFFINTRYLVITFLLFIFFSIIDLVLLNTLIKKHKIIIVLYFLCSYLVCDFLSTLIEEGLHYPYIEVIKTSFYMYIDFLTRDFIFLLFFSIFLLIKLFPCHIIIGMKNTKNCIQG